MTRCWFKKKI